MNWWEITAYLYFTCASVLLVGWGVIGSKVKRDPSAIYGFLAASALAYWFSL